MDEERYLILKMLEEGKITAEEASALIAALEDEGAGTGSAGTEGDAAEGAGAEGARADSAGEGAGARAGAARGAEGAGYGRRDDRDRGRERRRHGGDRHCEGGPHAGHAHGGHYRGHWFDGESFESAMEEMRRDLEKVRLGAMDIGDEVSRRVQEAMRGQREIWRRGGPRSFRHMVRNLGDVFSVPFGREMHEERYEKEVSVRPDVRVDIRDLSGDVKVEAIGEDTVKVRAIKRVWAGSREEAKDRSADYQVVVEQQGNEVRIGAGLTEDAPGWLPARCTIDYDVQVPAGTRAVVSLTNGDVTVTGVRGGVELRSTNGDLVIKDVSGSVSATSINGNIELRSAEPGDLSLKTVNGDVRVDLVSLGAGDHGVHTTRGNIVASVPAEMPLDFLASTMHGDIDLELPCSVISRSSTRLEGRVGAGRTRSTAPGSVGGAPDAGGGVPGAASATGNGRAPGLELRALFGDITLRARKED